MIIDNIQNIGMYKNIGKYLDEAINYILTTNFDKISPGKYQVIGDDVFAIISEYETKNEDDGFWEAHEKYIDIQYIAKGIEKIGYSNIERFEIKNCYDCDSDVALGRADGDFITLFPGDFMILFPQDVHKPGNQYCEKAQVKKVVVKVKIY
ncbi:YhcH/YjgK/YiaL family protein [Helicovermis profundi]|uniref:YhcH/YjgK/YiaL family protein n=1 Tax=Helicovermis profundi TaxID=3065157 RepID=A0AAU9EDZ7_9FIRM|nr:YhcH/YjgK/YiaL family protein [Clostridia bacterium S502]